MGWNYWSIPKRQRCSRWGLRMDKSFHPHFVGHVITYPWWEYLILAVLNCFEETLNIFVLFAISRHFDSWIPTSWKTGIYRDLDNSYPRQLVPKKTRTQGNSYPRQLVPRTTRTQDNSYPGQLVPTTTRTQDNTYPELGHHGSVNGLTSFQCIPLTFMWFKTSFMIDASDSIFCNLKRHSGLNMLSYGSTGEF